MLCTAWLPALPSLPATLAGDGVVWSGLICLVPDWRSSGTEVEEELLLLTSKADVDVDVDVERVLSRQLAIAMGNPAPAERGVDWNTV